MVKRRLVNASPNGQKRTHSCNHCFAQMVVCGDCGEFYRRVHWNNHGCKSIVWRCISKLQPTSASCSNRTVNEELLKEVSVKAINLILSNKDDFLKALQQNIAQAVLSADTLSPEGIDARMDELQKELLKQVEGGKDYQAVATEILRLKEQKEKAKIDSHSREETMKRIAELQQFIAEQNVDITEFDENLTKRLIQKITVYHDSFTVEFKSGVSVEIKA